VQPVQGGEGSSAREGRGLTGQRPCCWCGGDVRDENHATESVFRQVMRQDLGWRWAVIMAGMCLTTGKSSTWSATLEELDPDLAKAWKQYQHKVRLKAEMTHCRKGHEFTEENTYVKKTGARVCMKCKRLYARLYLRKNPNYREYERLRSTRKNLHVKERKRDARNK